MSWLTFLYILGKGKLKKYKKKNSLFKYTHFLIYKNTECFFRFRLEYSYFTADRRLNYFAEEKSISV